MVSSYYILYIQPHYHPSTHRRMFCVCACSFVVFPRYIAFTLGTYIYCNPLHVLSYSIVYQYSVIHSILSLFHSVPFRDVYMNWQFGSTQNYIEMVRFFVLLRLLPILVGSWVKSIKSETPTT